MGGQVSEPLKYRKMFTYRFFEMPIKLISLSAEERSEALGMEQDEVEEIESTVKILPLQIESYRSCIPEDYEFSPENMVATSVKMKSGDSFIVNWNLKTFEKKLNEFEENCICP